MNTKSKYAIYKVVFETDKKKPCRMYINSEKQNLVASFYDDPETVAMFQLFAAAPDMLEASEQAQSFIREITEINGKYSYLNSRMNNTVIISDAYSALRTIESAIAKAKGESHE